MRNQKPIIPYSISYPVSNTKMSTGKKVVTGLAVIGGGYAIVKVIGFAYGALSFLVPVALLGVAGYVWWKFRQK